jgi:hypothetical protein
MPVAASIIIGVLGALAPVFEQFIAAEEPQIQAQLTAWLNEFNAGLAKLPSLLTPPTTL